MRGEPTTVMRRAATAMKQLGIPIHARTEDPTRPGMALTIVGKVAHVTQRTLYVQGAPREHPTPVPWKSVESISIRHRSFEYLELT